MFDRANFYSISEGHKELLPQQKLDELDNPNVFFSRKTSVHLGEREMSKNFK